MRVNAWKRMPRLNGLWRQGIGTVEDPNNGRLIWQILGIHPADWRHYPGPVARTFAGYLRLAWNELTRYETEVCQRCGRKVRQVWWCPDDALWSEITGCRTGGGILCVRCFDELYSKLGKGFVRWIPMDSSVSLQRESGFQNNDLGIARRIRPN